MLKERNVRIKSLKSACSAVALALGILNAGNAAAVPVLQLYIEGATYDAVNESWYIDGQDFYLWAIGNLTGPGGTGGSTIKNVRLAAVYDTPPVNPAKITITGAMIGAGSGSYNGFSDASIASDPILLQTESDGSTPLIGGNKSLPGHGKYGAGRTWQEFALGDFENADSQLVDFVQSFPVPGVADHAQINAYHVVVQGPPAHFDLYGEVVDARGRISYVFAPPGRDATDGPALELAFVPVPATLALLGIGALGLGLSRRKLAIR